MWKTFDVLSKVDGCISFFPFVSEDLAIGVLAQVEPEVLISSVGSCVIDADSFIGNVVPLFGTGSHSLWTVLFML